VSVWVVEQRFRLRARRLFVFSPRRHQDDREEKGGKKGRRGRNLEKKEGRRKGREEYQAEASTRIRPESPISTRF